MLFKHVQSFWIVEFQVRNALDVDQQQEQFLLEIQLDCNSCLLSYLYILSLLQNGYLGIRCNCDYSHSKYAKIGIPSFKLENVNLWPKNTRIHRHYKQWACI
jgi:hypothetical protein